MSFLNVPSSVSTRKMSDGIRRRFSLSSGHKDERDQECHDREIDVALRETDLNHTTTVRLEKKDFSQEVRGARDIRNFLEKSQIILDLAKDQLEDIVDKLLEAAFSGPDGECETVTMDELKSLIFVDEERTALAHSIQSVSKGASEDDGHAWDQTWICGMANVPTLKKRHVAIARLKHNTNLGTNAQEARFLILVLCPTDVKPTKSATETGRTFATLFSDVGLRHDLEQASTVDEFKEIIKKTANMFGDHQDPAELSKKAEAEKLTSSAQEENPIKWYQIGKGIKRDLMGRLPYYLDDYRDGILGKNTIQKTVATTLFLYFSVILPAVALGVLNSYNTHGQISVQQVMVGQTIGAIAFTIFAGQPLVVVMTTAPLALYIKIIYLISQDFEIDFLAFYAAIGLWNTFFLIIYSLCNMSVLMKFSSRSTEEIFSNFITIAFITDSLKNMVKTFNDHYWSDDCGVKNTHVGGESELSSPLAVNASSHDDHVGESTCEPEVAFLSLILMLGTVWLGVTLFNFTKTPFLNKTKREFLSDYALPVAVIVFSLVGTVLFSGVHVKTFPYETKGNALNIVNFESLDLGSIFLAGVLGFFLSLLFFMDQNISAAMVDSPDNKLVKGNAYHWDLLVVGIINAFLCVFGLPFLHAVLPHSPLHVKCLADTEERVENGYVRTLIVRVRETRLTNLFSNILIGLSMLFLHVALDFIPTAVLDGLFLYLALTALYGNQMFERVTLFFIEQSAYPPHHYIRRVPQRKIHVFTVCQMFQLAVLCVFGFTPWPYIKMIFPFILLTFLPVRHKLIPKIVEQKYLNVLDGH